MSQLKSLELTPQEFTRRLVENPLLWQQIKDLFDRPRPAYLTYEEFLDPIDEDTLAEWVDGEIIMASPASRKHQLIGDFLNHIIAIYVEQH